MKEPHIEGVATHDDPESCAVVRKDGGEALTGAHMGWVLSREIKGFGVPTLSSEAEGHMSIGASASRWATLRGRRPHARVEPLCTGTGRSTDPSMRMAHRDASGRPEAAR
jgi:hypothetical protein